MSSIFDKILQSRPYSSKKRTEDYSNIVKESNFFNTMTAEYNTNIFEQDLDKNSSLSYITNQYGYRKYDDKIDSVSFIGLGCSDTFGVGNHLQDTWVYKISKELNKPAWNLGVPGAGIDRCYLSLKLLPDSIQYDTVFFLVPAFFRTFLFFDHYDDNNSSELHHYTGNPDHIPLLKFKNFSVDKEESTLRIALNIENVATRAMVALDGIENICKKKNAKLYYILHPIGYSSQEFHLQYGPFGKALDGNHLDASFQSAISKEFLKKLS